MTENLGKITALTIAVLIAAVASMVGPILFGESPFRLGLDLQGGTRLVYQLPFEKAVETGQITAAELADKPALLQSTATIMRGRIDPQGVLEMSIRPEGTDRIVIELPGAAELATTETTGKLRAALDATAQSLELDGSDVALVKLFPQSGGLVRIGSERILYATRSGTTLAGLKRGAEKTAPSPHEVNAAVELLSSDDLQKRIENVGDMQFLVQANAADFSRAGSDEASELSRMQTWRAANPTAPIEDFNRLPRDQSGPIDGLRWHPMRLGREELEVALTQRPMIPLVVPRPTAGGDANTWNFSGSDLESVIYSQDEYGYPAVAFEMTPEKRVAFGDFTQASIGRGMAIVLNGEIATLATIRSKLPGGGQISGGAGGFTQKEVQDLITVLRSGSLKIKPVLLDKSRVGASLGEDYVSKGMISALFALLVVIVFMVYTYKRLGMFAVLGLLVNLVLLMGALAFLRATLTLPGIAGIVLTVGMAVDGNILIFERLREELARGLKLKDAARAGFERAAVTILDANLTTLIAGAILYWAGTGPIRGFATTLCIGILTTLFTVIVVSKLLLFRDLNAGRSGYEMRELIKGQGIDFLGKTRAALTVSTILIVGTVGLFLWQPEKEKLCIDFLGGYSISARTQEPQSVQSINDALRAAGGSVATATVQAITDSSQGAGYTEFRITAKLGEQNSEESAKSAEVEVRRALATMLQRGPVDLKLADGAVSGEIYFESPHATEDISASLTKDGLSAVTVQAMATPANAYSFTAKAGASATQAELSTLVTRRFTATLDTKGVPYTLMSPIPESTVVGPQVGGELRDKAIRAMLLALFATILYLRFRFDQWSYGIAVVAALAHDVLITLGALAVANQFGFVQSEIDLSMVAAFLTIIGYSQNDTIVIFDRVRENIGKSKKPLRDILNDSVNETLGRTILTSVTVFLTIVVLFVANYGSRNVLEGFSFAMLIGVISGTYSTIYIASPVLLWLEKRAGRAEASTAAEVAAKA